MSGARRGNTGGMDVARVLAAGLSVNRIAFGANMVLQPEQARWSWVGRVARKPGAQVMIRSQGARDVALGLGALYALARRPDTASTWMAAHAIADGVDTAATLGALERLPARRGRFAVGVAAGSTVVAVVSAALLSRR